MKTIIFFVRTKNFNLKDYQEKIFNNHKPKNWSNKKISDNLFNCYLNLKEIKFDITFEELHFSKEQTLIDSATKIVNLSFNLSKGLNTSESMDANDNNKQRLIDLILLKLMIIFHINLMKIVIFLN